MSDTVEEHSPTGTNTKQNISHNTFSSKPHFSPINRTLSPFTSRHFNVSQPQQLGQPQQQQHMTNLSSTTTRGGLGALGAHSFTQQQQRSYVNSPRDRLQTTFGLGGAGGGVGGGGFGSGSIAGIGGSTTGLSGIGDLRKDACGGGIGVDGGPSMAKPIAPELCLEYLWIDNSTNK